MFCHSSRFQPFSCCLVASAGCCPVSSLSGSFGRCPIVGYLAATAICRPSLSISVRPFPAICLANDLSPFLSIHSLVRHCLLTSRCSVVALAATLIVAVVFRSFSRLCLSGSFCMFPTALRRHSDRLSSLALTVFSAHRPFVSVSLRLVRPVPSDRLFHPVRSFVFPHVFV